MKRTLLVAVFTFSTLPAFAQQQPPAPPFVPFTVTETDYRDLMQYLNDNVPGRYAAPIGNFLNGLQQRAAQAKVAAEKKPEPPAEPQK